MSVADATKQASVNSTKALGNWISLHTGAAGTTGANEATGGGYTRVQTTFGSGNPASGTPVNVPCAAGTYPEYGLWSAQTGGTFVGSVAFTGGAVTVTAATGGSITVTASIAS